MKVAALVSLCAVLSAVPASTFSLCRSIDRAVCRQSDDRGLTKTLTFRPNGSTSQCHHSNDGISLLVAGSTLGFGDDFSLWPDDETKSYFNDNIKLTTEEDMRSLVLSLSEVQSDIVRRRRLEEKFDREYANNITWNEFVALFDSTLNIVGGNIQRKAARKHKHGGKTSKGKTTEQLQLWACVDMLIQSKTIVKRKNKTLGSNSIFA